jgi:predicted transcriptional regulator
MSAVKQQAHKLIDTLPEAASWDDVVRVVDQARFQEAVREGIEAADRGDFASAERVKAMFAKWGVDAET